MAVAVLPPEETVTMIFMKRLYPVAVVLAGAAACTVPAAENGAADPNAVQASPPGEAQCFDPSPSEQASGLQFTNAARARAGRQPVRANTTLAGAAAAHACDMAQRGRMTHVGSSSPGPGARVRSLGYAPRVTAENIAAGPYSAEQALAAWNASSAHLGNILVPQLTDFGIGRAIGSDGHTVYWAAVYAGG